MNTTTAQTIISKLADYDVTEWGGRDGLAGELVHVRNGKRLVSFYWDATGKTTAACFYLYSDQQRQFFDSRPYKTAAGAVAYARKFLA